MIYNTKDYRGEAFQIMENNPQISKEVDKALVIRWRITFLLLIIIVGIATYGGFGYFVSESNSNFSAGLFLISVLFFVAILWFYGLRPLQQKISNQIASLKEQKDDSLEKKIRFDLALQGTNIGIWDWNIKANNFHWSPVLWRLLGMQQMDDFKPDVNFFQSLLHPLDKKRFNETIKKHLKSGDPFEVEIRLQHTSGDYIWTLIRGHALRDDNHKTYRMLGSIEDITEYKKSSLQTDIFIQGIEATNIAFAIVDLTDPQRRFSYASPAFCKLTHCPAEKVVSSNLNMFTGPETSMSSLDQIDYAFNSGEKLTVKMLNYRLDGTIFWNEIVLRPIVSKISNEKDSYIIIFNDLTESIQRERQEVSRQRTESLGALAGSVAHEINNLLMPMTMAKDMLENSLKDDCDPFAHEQLDIMVEYANQAKAIVAGILTFSRKETKNLENVNIYEELESAVRFIKSLLSNNTDLILKETDDDSIHHLKTLINTTELKQIITNLCKNAEDAFKDNSGIITISIDKRSLTSDEKTKYEVFASDFAVISVKDNGTGIPEEIKDKIFDPLFTTKDIGMGTGLGLSVVLGILRSWGGCIRVNSILGQGTTFEIFIPIQKTYEDYDHLSDLAETLDDFEVHRFFEG